MKIARFFAVILGCIGVVLLVGSMGFFLLNRNASVQILELPQEAVACSDAFAQALNEGDLEGAAQYIYGQPDLGVSSQPADAESAAIWKAFLDSISFEFSGECYAVDSGLARQAAITTLDVSGITGQLSERAQAMVDQKIASAVDLTEVYDEDGHFRKELAEEILQQALQQTIAQDGKTVTGEVTLKLINRDGKWWIVPDQNLLLILTGLA